MIPEGKLYSDKSRDLGEQSSLSPASHVISLAAASALGFGTMVKYDETDDEKVCLPDGNGVIAGLAAKSYEAKDIENLSYVEEDPVAVAVHGEFIGHVEEDVTRSSPVRIRIAEDAEHGYQEIGFSTDKTEDSATGLANDTTAYGSIVTIDNKAVELSLVGSAAQTLATLIAAVNTALGSKGTMSLVDNKLRITSVSTGPSSEVSITDALSNTTGLFGSLSDINDAFEEPVDGTDDGDPEKVPGRFCTTAISGQTALLSGAQFAGASVDGKVPVILTGSFNITKD